MTVVTEVGVPPTVGGSIPVLGSWAVQWRGELSISLQPPPSASQNAVLQCEQLRHSAAFDHTFSWKPKQTLSLLSCFVRVFYSEQQETPLRQHSWLHTHVLSFPIRVDSCCHSMDQSIYLLSASPNIQPSPYIIYDLLLLFGRHGIPIEFD